MAFLLLLHEKMRAKRQVNKLTLKQLRQGSRLERAQNNIKRMQDMYAKRQSILDKQAQMMQSQATVFFQNMMGLGAQNQMFNPMSYMGGTGGMTTAAAQIMATWTGEGSTKVVDGKTVNLFRDGAEAQRLYKELMNGQIKAKKGADGKVVPNEWVDSNNNPVSNEQYMAIQNAIGQANNCVQQKQVYCNQMSQQYQNNISIWLDAQHKQLDAEQDAVLAPLEMEQTEIELESETIKVQLEYAKAKLQSLEGELKEAIQNSVPKFGLG